MELNRWTKVRPKKVSISYRRKGGCEGRQAARGCEVSTPPPYPMLTTPPGTTSACQ